MGGVINTLEEAEPLERVEINVTNVDVESVEHSVEHNDNNFAEPNANGDTHKG